MKRISDLKGLIIYLVMIVSLLGSCRNDDSEAEQCLVFKSTAVLPLKSPVVEATLWFQPMDLSTSVQTTTPAVGLEALNENVDADLLQAISENLYLWTWPELEDVAGQATIEGWQYEGYPAKRRAFVSFEPTKPLDDKWYMLGVGNIPFKVEVGSDIAHLKLPDGSVAVRFRAGSQFIVRQLSICESDGSQILKVRFSEPVKLPVEATTVIIKDADSAEASCSRTPDPIDTSLLATELSMDCQSLKLPFNISISGNTESLGGDFLTDITGKTGDQKYLLELDSPNTMLSGCRVYYPNN